ncbi:S-adenosyl-L-methionine-dependent methyltransferase [Ilyonectria sp. MPI-CAGE-AT-0026]|nr:S-adenosyl-L-methionine-dependent methyltransferase [Ilyonectria sp. MPI-CAGE-AT-0026]
MSTADDDDSTYGGGYASSEFVPSVDLVFPIKHGRSYHKHKEGVYSFPNDDKEQARLDLVDEIWYQVLNGKLFLAPIELDRRDIFDIGTGTGAWPVRLANDYPEANIRGNDLSPIWPAILGSNIKFVVDDVEEEWIESGLYDYIHCRCMAGSIKNWPQLLSQIYLKLKPGGWVEFQETATTLYSEDGTLKGDNPMVEMMSGLKRACNEIGRTLDPAPLFQEWAMEAGFSCIQEEKFKVPIGDWQTGKRLKWVGSGMVLNFQEGVEGFTAVLFQEVLGWGPEKVAELNQRVIEASRCKNTHALLDFVVVTAQKPVSKDHSSPFPESVVSHE